MQPDNDASGESARDARAEAMKEYAPTTGDGVAAHASSRPAKKFRVARGMRRRAATTQPETWLRRILFPFGDIGIPYRAGEATDPFSRPNAGAVQRIAALLPTERAPSLPPEGERAPPRRGRAAA